MTETKMPAAEAGEMAEERELQSYELAFHVLPTVAEGEVPKVFADLKSLIEKDGGEIFDEEAPEHFELAYEIEKYLEGRHRKFDSTYFGWVRFRIESKAVVALTEEVEGVKDILRYLLVKLTRVEEENPFRFHEALADKKVKNVDLDESDDVETDAVVEDGETEVEDDEKNETEPETTTDEVVSEENTEDSKEEEKTV
jgi:ribosomal protein S6